MVERQLRWNKRKSDVLIGNQTPMIQYYVLIVNDNREINNIQTKIFEQLKPIDSLVEIKSKSFPDSHGLRYAFMEFISPYDTFQPRKVYGGKIVKDTNLYPRQKEGMLEEYIIKTIGAK